MLGITPTVSVSVRPAVTLRTLSRGRFATRVLAGSSFAGRIVQDGYGLGAVALVLGMGGYLYKSLRSDSESHRMEGPRSGPEIGTLTP